MNFNFNLHKHDTSSWDYQTEKFCPYWTVRSDDSLWLLVIGSLTYVILYSNFVSHKITHLTTMPTLFCSFDDTPSTASSRTIFMKGSKPRRTPVTCRPPFNLTIQSKQKWCFLICSNTAVQPLGLSRNCNV